MEKHDKPRLTASIWGRAIDHGDKVAIELIDRAIEALGTGVASAINLLDPEAIIIGGGLGLPLRRALHGRRCSRRCASTSSSRRCPT